MSNLHRGGRADRDPVTEVEKPGVWRWLHPKGWNEVEDGKAVAADAIPATTVGRDGSRSVGQSALLCFAKFASDFDR
jgi:hypothetical protein